jgi:hypothetical protein
MNKRSKVVLGFVLLGLFVVMVILSVSLRSRSPSGTTPTPSSSEALYFTMWRDPAENAFTIFLPKKWTAQGGTQSIGGGWGFSFRIKATDTTGTESIFFYLPDSENYIESSQYLSFWDGEPPEGQLWSPVLGQQYLVYHYLSAKDYIELFLLKDLRTNYPDAQIINITERPDLAWQLQTVQTSGADALFSFTVNGVSYRLSAEVLTIKSQVLEYSYWNIIQMGYAAPTKDFKNVGELYSMIIPTFKVNQTWLQQNSQNQARMTGMISNTFQRISEMGYQQWTEQEQSTMRSAEGWMTALDGAGTFTDPDGNTYELSLVSGYDLARNPSTGDVVYYPSGSQRPQGFDDPLTPNGS